MNKLRLTVLATGLALLLPVAGYAQSISEVNAMDPEDRRAYMESMSPQERQQMRNKWREELQSMPEEERKAINKNMAADRPGGKRNREAMRQRWEAMSDEERAAAREKKAQRKQQRREKWESMSDEERAAARQKRADRKPRQKRQKSEENLSRSD